MLLLPRQLMYFLAVGALATGIHFIVLAGTVHCFGVNPVIGSAAGFLSGAGVNYLLNYRFTFNCSSPHMETSLKFFTIAGSGLLLNTVLMFLLTMNLHYLLSQAIATAMVLVWNFLCHRFWTFRETSLVKQQ